MRAKELIEITNTNEYTEDCFGLWVHCDFHAIVYDHPGHTMDECRDAFLGLLEQRLKEGRICLFATWGLRRSDRIFDTKIRKVPDFDEIWDIPHDEMIAWIRDNWPKGITHENDCDLNIFFYATCPGIGWFVPETGEIVAP